MRKEERFAFKKELLQVHKKNRRNKALLPENDEFVIQNGIRIVVAEDADIITMTAARDFEDYLFVSMNIPSMVTTEESAPMIRLLLNQDIEDASGYMGYRITVGDENITVEGYDERGIAQGLYYLEDLMNIRKAPYLKKGVIKRKAVFQGRNTHSPFGMFEWPDEALALVAHAGMDTISFWMHSGFTSQRGSNFLDLRLITERCEKYGIKVAVSLAAPHDKHPDDPGAQEYYDKLYGDLFLACPKIACIGVVGENTNFVSKDPKAGTAPHSSNHVDNIPTGKWSPGWWPCNDYAPWLNMILNAIRKHSDTCELLFSTYNWGFAPEEDRIALINSLPDGITIQPTWDMFQQYRVGDIVEDVVDYTLARPGPGDYFVSEATAAKARGGLKLQANAQCSGRTWDFGVVPYEPMPRQWIKRWEGLVKAHDDWDLQSICENIHYGFYPSFILDMEKQLFFTNAKSGEEILDDVLCRDFDEHAEAVKKATEFFDQAITHYCPTNEDQYGAYRIGPAYPFWLEDVHALPSGLPQEGKKPDTLHPMFGHHIYFSRYVPDVAGRNSLTGVRIYQEIASTEKMRDLMWEGIQILKSCENPNENLERLIGLAEFIYRTIVTVIHVKRHYILKQQLSIIGNAENAEKILDEIEALLLAEKENVKATIPLVQADSRLGWEPSMEYTTDEEGLLWKLRQLDYELDFILPKFRKGNRLSQTI